MPASPPPLDPALFVGIVAGLVVGMFLAFLTLNKKEHKQMENSPKPPDDLLKFVTQIPLRDDVPHEVQLTLVRRLALAVIPFVADAVFVRERTAGRMKTSQEGLDEAIAEFTRWTTQAIEDNDDSLRTIAAVLRHAARFALQNTAATIKEEPCPAPSERKKNGSA